MMIGPSKVEKKKGFKYSGRSVQGGEGVAERGNRREKRGRWRRGEEKTKFLKRKPGKLAHSGSVPGEQRYRNEGGMKKRIKSIQKEN